MVFPSLILFFFFKLQSIFFVAYTFKTEDLTLTACWMTSLLTILAQIHVFTLSKSIYRVSNGYYIPNLTFDFSDSLNLLICNKASKITSLNQHYIQTSMPFVSKLFFFLFLSSCTRGSKHSSGSLPCLVSVTSR